VLNEAGEPMEELTALPVGTQVADRRGDTLAQYLVLEGGKRREITSDDTKFGSVTYEELRTSEPGQAMPEHFIEIHERLRGIGGTTPDDRDAQLAELKIYLAAREPRLRHVDLLRMTARRLFQSDEPQAAIAMCRDIAQVSDVFSRVLSPLAEEYEGELRRAALPGSEIVLTGRTVEGAEFDWSSYRGNVVLVYFWFTGCPPCIEEMPQIKEVYDKYHDAGFDVVGISSDASKETLTAYLADQAIGWANIHEPAAESRSNARRYNIRAWPTAILVNRDGKVVTLEAGVEELEGLLIELLGGG
jgi:thiol-disulfide isomerase/thioredoxin